MSTNKLVPIDYTSRDFNTIKADLLEHARRYYPDTYGDFSEAGFGSLALDTVAYVGDILSFYLDFQVNESFLHTAIQYNNIEKIGKQQGYKARLTPTSHGIIALYITVPSNSNGLGPDTDYLPILKTGATFSAESGQSYTLISEVDFSDSDNEIVVAEVDRTTGIPTSYAVRAYGQIISGIRQSVTVDVGDFARFKSILLPASNVSEILSVIDSEGHVYYEVDYLSQNTVFIEVVNRGNDRQSAKTVLKPVIVPRRFVVENVGGNTFLQFGYGSEENLTNNQIVDPSDVLLERHGKNYFSDTSFDPSKLTKTDKFGVVPTNTTLAVTYRSNPSIVVNAAANTVNTITSTSFIFPKLQEGASLSQADMNSVAGSIECTNQEPVVGGTNLPSADELKHRIFAHQAAQNRAVTRNDYISMIYNMPSRLGSVKRVNIVQDTDSFKRNLNVYVLSEDSLGSLTRSNSIIKSNLKNWISRYKMINDTVDILDAYIVNIGIDFTAVAMRGYNRFEIIESANGVLAERIAARKPDIGERFYISDVYNILKYVPGISDVVDVTITRKVGGNYSDTTFFLDEFIDPDGKYIDVPENVVLEIKFPSIDIRGTIR